MIGRIWTLALYLVRDLFQSLAGIVPLAAALAFGLIAFEYGMDQPQFVTVAGVGTGVIGFFTTLLLAGRANQAAMAPLLVRLRHRGELLVALWLAGLGLTGVLAVAIAAANLLAQRLTLSWPSLLWILPTWLGFWLMVCALALVLSGLVSRDGTNLVGYVLLVGMLVIHDQRALLVGRGFDWLVSLVDRALQPTSVLFARASAGMHDRTYLLGLGLTLAGALVLFLGSVVLFSDKDLVWAE